MRSILLISSFLFLAGATSTKSATCYFANGTALPITPYFLQYRPCFTGGPPTVCCALFRDNAAGGNITDGETEDECLPNGLCQNRAMIGGEESTHLCADSDIKNGKCLDVCAQVRDASDIARITPCDGRSDSERWCCGDDTTCCTSNVGVVTLPQIMRLPLSSSVSSQANLPTIAATSKASSAPTASVPTLGTQALARTSPALAEHTGESTGLSGGAIAGIVIGAIAGLALLATAIFFSRRASKYKKVAAVGKYVEGTSGYYPQQPDQREELPVFEKYAEESHVTHSFSQHSGPYELPSAEPSELPSDEVSAPARSGLQR